MADFARYLPLSQREPNDESGANANWRGHIAATLTATADLLAGLSPAQWDTPSLCEGWRVRHVAGHIIWRLGSSTMDLVTSAARASLRHNLSVNRAIDELSRAVAADAEPATLVARIREIAVDRAAGNGRRGVGELAEAVVHGYDLARPLGLELPVASLASGAVVLSRSLTAPSAIKAVVRGRTLVATDAEWRVGHGPELRGTAEAHVLFLYGRGGLPSGS